MNLEKNDIKKWMFLIVFAILIFFLVKNIWDILGVVGTILSLLFPFILGLCIAFIVNVPATLLETKIFRVDKIKKKKTKNLIRTISIIISLALVIGIIGFVLFLVIPEIGETLASLANNIPHLLTDIGNWFEKMAEEYPDLEAQINALDWNNISKEIMTFIKTSMNGLLTGSLSFITGIISGVTSLIMGIVFSVYILSQKESLGKQVKKVLYAYLPQNIVKKTLEITTITSNTFNKFITGQCLEAIILGTLFFIALTIFRFPYALTISVLTTVTALIPIFGALFAMVIGAILIAVTNPIQAIWFMVLFQVLQQIEGNFIYPKVVGKSVGLPALWVMLAVMVGGGAFGITGMLVSVPISSIAYTLFKDYIKNRLKTKKIEIA